MLPQISNSSTKMNKTPKHQKSPSVDWFSHINDDSLKLVIPIGPRFQADVPEWNGPPHKKYPHSDLSDSKSTKWLGTVIWPMENTTHESEREESVIGKGRPESCNCGSPGSIFCCKRHVAKKTANLYKILGPAFQKWRFDLMGESVAKLWKQPEQQRLTHIIRKSLLSEDKDFIKPALDCFPLRSKKDIISYYFNVFVPRRMSVQTRSGCKTVDTDDDDDEDEMSKKPCSKGSGKRARVDGTTFCSPKLVKTRYLTGRR